MTPFDPRPLVEAAKKLAAAKLAIAQRGDHPERPLLPARTLAGMAMHVLCTVDAILDWGSHTDAQAARIKELEEALSGLAALYDTDEGCRSTPEYIAARAALEPRS